MTWLAKPVPSKAPMQAMMGKVFVFFLLLSIYDAFAAPPLFEVTVNEKGDLILHQNLQYRWRQMIYVLVSLPMTIYGIMVVVKLRAAIRTKYGIPTGKLGKLEDWCYVCWCNCCVMSQLARQTADYDDEPATCCSSTGMKEPLHPSAHDDYLVPAVLL